jgi:ABC-2 type transport system permease protein
MRRLAVRTLAMAQKEVVHIVRDPQILAFALVMPFLLIILFGYAVTFDVDRIPLVVVDGDRTQSSRNLVFRFAGSRTFRIVAHRDRAQDAERLFRSNTARAAIVIPHGYARRLKRGETAQAQLLLDGADNTTASIALGYGRAVSLAASQSQIEAALGKIEPPLSARVRVFFNPGVRSSVFLVPGLMVIVLVMIAVMITALTVAREYESGSMEQLFATPVGRLEVILGKLAPYFVIGLIQALMVLTLGVVLFEVPVNGSLGLLFTVTAVFLLAALMQGLLVSVVTRNQMVASMVAMITTFLPALLLSGFIFPIDNMPTVLQGVAAVLPPQYFVRTLRAILLRGNDIGVIWTDLTALFGFFLLFLIIAVLRFKRRVG